MLWLGRKRPERDEQELVRVRAQVLELSHNYAYRRAKYMYMYSYTKNVRRRGTIPPLPPNVSVGPSSKATGFLEPHSSTMNLET